MANISGQIRIEAPVEEVFDTVADSRNEPRFNPDMKDVELLTPPPIGAGTRFQATMGAAGTPMLVELTEVDRPRRLRSQTSSELMDTSGTLSFAPDGQATVMSWDWDVTPKGWLRLLGPVFGIVGARVERRIWAGLKRHLEDGGAAAAR
jgi:uncharacterized protein YndB with AHSA1/START domain